MGKASPQGAANWHEIAAVRARDLPSRLVFSVLIAAGGAWVASGSWPLIWLTATVVAQLATLIVTEPMRREPNFPVSTARARAFYASIALSAVVFAACGPLFWFDGGSGGRLFSFIVLSGAVVNSAMQAGDSTRLLWAACGPIILVAQALPFISFFGADGSERKVLGLTGLAAGLLTLHLALAAQRGLRSASKVKDALAEADRERLRAEAASAAKSDFLAVMSHELRTPLNGVLGMAQAMAGDRLARAQRGRLDVIRQSGEILLVLLNDLLDLSEIDTARLQIVPGIIDVAGLAEQVEAVFSPLAEAKQVGFSVQLLDSAGVARLGDPMRVRQVLHNLVANAVKFTEEGLVSVVISGDDDELLFAVADTGSGVAPDKAHLLFQRFGQSDPSATRRRSGAGLGLAIARGLAQLMGGDVTMRSTPGEGSVFTAHLKLPRAQAAPALGLAAPDAAPGPEQLRVLAAEDNPINQLVLKTLLEQIGITVQFAGDGEEAVAAWRSGRWDVVLMDIQMPVMDGLAATRAIRVLEAAEGRPRTPIIAVTANGVAEQASEYMDAGMDALVPKPIQLKQLLTAIDAAVSDEAVGEIRARTAA
jgi:signal transduction histidine kinase/CheY-like chemotaxis protein